MGYKEELASRFCGAIKKLSGNEDAINNLESYLTAHFYEWMSEYASTAEGITDELEQFARMYD